jgi:uncharacterized protein
MGIVIDNEFVVAAPPDDTFALLVDVERVAPCIPGAEVTGRRPDGSYDARVSLRMGPMALTYSGTASITDIDAAARRAVMRARGNEQRGQGTAQATVTMQVFEQEKASRVTLHTDILVTGRVAQMGRGIMIDIAGRMIDEMARALEETLTRDASHRQAVTDAEASQASPPPPPEAVRAKQPSVVDLAMAAIRGRRRRR